MNGVAGIRDKASCRIIHEEQVAGIACHEDVPQAINGALVKIETIEDSGPQNGQRCIVCKLNHGASTEHDKRVREGVESQTVRPCHIGVDTSRGIGCQIDEPNIT